MAFSQDDRSGWNHVEILGDDTCVLNMPLGFTFAGFGATTTTVSLNSNGVLIFGSTCNAAGSDVNSALPTAAVTTNPALYYFWDDLNDFGGGEYIEYTTTGNAGGRVFHLYARQRLLNGVCGTDPVNVMLSVHEGSNLVHAEYSGMSGCANMRGASATLGMQTTGGAAAKAFLVGYNAQVLDNDSSFQSISFHPPN